MSIVHLNQIKNHILEKYSEKIDIADLSSHSGQHLENHKLTRSLSAFIIDSASNCGPDLASQSITDFSDDNGIDAVLVDIPSNAIYVTQTKWIASGIGEPSLADINKYVCGIKDLLNCKFEKFNEKIKCHDKDIVRVLNNPGSHLTATLAYTGKNALAKHGQKVIDDFLKEVNDVSEYISFKYFNQAEIYKLLTKTISGDPIDIDLLLTSWGKIEEPSLAYYGQLNGQELNIIWSKYGSRLLAKNIRNSLGDTEVNESIKRTILTDPKNFWYFNNGVTLTAKRVRKTLSGGSNRDTGVFHCEDVSVVNGAQTLSTIGKIEGFGKDNLGDIFVSARIISLEDRDIKFEEKITKSNNFQNRMENRDFVSLDPQQERIRNELAIEGITYCIKRDMDFSTGPKSFDLTESTSALSCASGNPNIMVLLKREIGSIWLDISRPPYTNLFNPNLSSAYLYRCVMINRKIDHAILEKIAHTPKDSTIHGVLVHGNKILSGLIFSWIDQKNILNLKGDFDEFMKKIDFNKITEDSLIKLSNNIDRLYPGSILLTLFKNGNKCTDLFKACMNPNSSIAGGFSIQNELNF